MIIFLIIDEHFIYWLLFSLRVGLVLRSSLLPDAQRTAKLSHSVLLSEQNTASFIVYQSKVSDQFISDVQTRYLILPPGMKLKCTKCRLMQNTDRMPA